MEFWQLVVLDGESGKYQASTPRALIYPRMAKEPEKDKWVEKNSEMIKVMFTILERALSQEPPKFEMEESELFALPRAKSSIKKKRPNELAEPDEPDEPDDRSELAGFEELQLGTSLDRLINLEYDQISDMFKLLKAPRNLLEQVFTRVSESLGNQKYPSELQSELKKLPLIYIALNEVVSFFKKGFGLASPKELEIDLYPTLAPYGVQEKIDFLVSQTVGAAGGRKRNVFIVVEAKKELPRHALRKCLLYLDRLQSLDVNQVVGREVEQAAAVDKRVIQFNSSIIPQFITLNL